MRTLVQEGHGVAHEHLGGCTDLEGVCLGMPPGEVMERQREQHRAGTNIVRR